MSADHSLNLSKSSAGSDPIQSDLSNPDETEIGAGKIFPGKTNNVPNEKNVFRCFRRRTKIGRDL